MRQTQRDTNVPSAQTQTDRDRTEQLGHHQRDTERNRDTTTAKQRDKDRDSNRDTDRDRDSDRDSDRDRGTDRKRD